MTQYTVYMLQFHVYHILYHVLGNFYKGVNLCEAVSWLIPEGGRLKEV